MRSFLHLPACTPRLAHRKMSLMCIIPSCPLNGPYVVIQHARHLSFLASPSVLLPEQEAMSGGGGALWDLGASHGLLVRTFSCPSPLPRHRQKEKGGSKEKKVFSLLVIRSDQCQILQRLPVRSWKSAVDTSGSVPHRVGRTCLTTCSSSCAACIRCLMGLVALFVRISLPRDI